MIKSVIHLADIHLRTYRYHDEYNEVFENLYREIQNVLETYDYEDTRIVIVGDIFHQKITISNESLLMCSRFFKRLAEIAPLVIVAGNHDLLENNQDRLDSITPVVGLLDNDNIQYLKGSECYEDGNIVWCNYSVFEGCRRPDIDTARMTYGSDKKYIGLYHAPLIGAKTDVGYKFESGTPLDVFNGCDAVLCGDIHLRQIITSDIPVVMPGSLIQQDFGESVNNHGFLVWDVETLTFEAIDIENPYKFYTFEVNGIDDIDNDLEILKNN
jgi:DNA repair exonuclease SbcCD nuclease subunit